MPTLTEKILAAHLTDGEMKPGNEIGLRIDQTLTQDATDYLSAQMHFPPRVFQVQALASIPKNESGKTRYRALEEMI